jgi:hypothetical protein
MTTTDVWTAPTVTFDQPSYVKGDKMTLTVSGVVDTQSVTSNLPPAMTSILFTAADGSTSTFNFAVPPVSQTIVSSPAVTMTTVVDNSGRLWTVSGLTATATA